MPRLAGQQTLFIAIIVAIILAVGGIIWYETDRLASPATTTGVKPDTSDYTYINASGDTVLVDAPTPGATVGKQFSITGKARAWYFEGSFPCRVFDKDGAILAQGPAMAQGDWMINYFVPFKVDITIPDSYTGPATIVLYKDNPSALPQYDSSVSFPITIQ